MFRIITTFIRQDMSNKFFYEEYGSHSTVLLIREKFFNTPGHREIEILLDSDLKIEIAMNFDSAEHFWKFAKDNWLIIEDRKQLINEWCDKVGHIYGWRIEEVNT